MEMIFFTTIRLRSRFMARYVTHMYLQAEYYPNPPRSIQPHPTTFHPAPPHHVQSSPTPPRSIQPHPTTFNPAPPHHVQSSSTPPRSIQPHPTTFNLAPPHHVHSSSTPPRSNATNSYLPEVRPRRGSRSTQRAAREWTRSRGPAGAATA